MIVQSRVAVVFLVRQESVAVSCQFMLNNIRNKNYQQEQDEYERSQHGLNLFLLQTQK